MSLRFALAAGKVNKVQQMSRRQSIVSAKDDSVPAPATSVRSSHPADDNRADGMIIGVLGVSSAINKFKRIGRASRIGSDLSERNETAMASEPTATSTDEPLPSVSSEDVFGKMTKTATSLSAFMTDQSAAQLSEYDELWASDRYALLRAAKNREWVEVDRLLKSYKKNDPDLNLAEPRTGETVLMMACGNSRFLLVGTLLEMGVAQNQRSEDRRTALHYAAAVGHEEIVKLLLRHRTDPNLFGGKDSQLPIHITALRGASGIVQTQFLLRASLKESRILRDGLGCLPITYAVESQSLVLVREMLTTYAKEQVAWRYDSNGDYLVHIATRKKSIDILNCLFTLGGADVNVRNIDGQTPLHIAARLGSETIVKLLHAFKAEPNIIDRKERTPLHVAAEQGHTAIVEMLLRLFKANVYMRTKDGSTLMHLAASNGHENTVKAFIRRGVPLNMPNKFGYLCIHVAAQNGHLDVVRTLVIHGSSVDARTKDGNTALHLAVLHNRPLIIQVLLGFGAKVDLKGGPLKEAPLHTAARLPEGYQSAEYLLKSGAFVNISTDETLETPLHIAAKAGSADLLKLLLEEGGDPMKLNTAGETALHIAVRHCWYDIAKTITDFANNHPSGRLSTNLVNLANGEGEACFHLAAELGKSQMHNPFEDVDIIRLLLENGADPLGVTKLTHETSLHYCARSGNPDILHEIVRFLKGTFQLACNRQDLLGWSPVMTASEVGHAAVTEILLANGARADVFDEFGKAALHLAAENGHIECCEILLKYKAFVNAKSKLGISPLHFAAQSGHTKLVKLLIMKYHASMNALSLDKKTSLHVAAAAGRKDVCQLLMSLRTDASAMDAQGQNPLHLAAENDHPEVVKLFIKLKPELVTSPSKSGMTCAHIAANNGSEAVVKLLMQFNKSLVTTVPNQVNEALPLHLAVSASHEHVVKILIDAGASPLAENHEGMTAIHMAAKEGDMEVLEAIMTSSPKKALSTNSLKNGLSPLHFAAFYGKAEIMRELLTYVDVNAKTDYAQLPGVVTDPALRTLISTDVGSFVI